jgi:hypothetical protein
MFLGGAIQSGTKGRRTAIFAAKAAAIMAAVLSVPVMMYSFGQRPPLPYTGAPGQGTCASCHGTLTTPSMVSVNAPTSYTPGGAAVPMTVTIPSTGGYELAVLTQSGNAQAGALTADAAGASAVSTVSTIQYVWSNTETTSWTFSWTPPATNVGNVVVYVTGGQRNTNYSNSYVITAGGGTTTPTLTAMPTSLSFTVNGAAPADQTISVTSGGSPIAVTASSSTTPSGSWLTIMPPGGNTPLTETVHIVAAGLAAGTYNGNVSFASTGASNSPLSVPVTLTVTTPIPPAVPTLMLSTSSLNFTATVGGANPASQNVMVTTSTGSAVTFTDSATTATGGNWLSVDTTADTTPTLEPISVTLPPGLGAGTYTGTVTFSAAGAVSNSPVSLPVTLTVTPATPPPTSGGETFSLVVVDRQSGGSDWMLLDGTGSVSSSGTVTGSGFFTRFHNPSTRGEGGTTATPIVSSGTWKPTSVTSFTPVAGSTTGGTLVLQVQITTQGVTATSTGTLTITSTGSSSGVKLAITGGSTFNSVGIGTESITSTTTGGGGGGDDGGGTGTGGTGTTPPPTDN